MLSAAIVPGAAAVLSLFLNIRATPQGNATASGSMAIARRSIEKSIFETYDYDPESGIIDTLYNKLLKDCVDIKHRGNFHSGIIMRPLFKLSKPIGRKRMLIMQYVFSCTDPFAEVNRLVSADPIYKRYEAFIDVLITAPWCTASYEKNFKTTEHGNRISEYNREKLKPRILEFLWGKVEKAVSVRTGEYLNGVFTADTVLDAFLHLRRRCSLSGASFYDELTELLASALKSKDRNRTIREFIKPLMDSAVQLWRGKKDHVLHCAQSLRDSMKDIDVDEAREIVMDLVDWEMLSDHLLCKNSVEFFEIAADMKVNPSYVTKTINSFYKDIHLECNMVMLSAISAYYLDVLDSDGQPRLKLIAGDRDLIDGLPSGVIRRLLADCTKLSAEYPAEAEYLKARLNGEPDPKKRKFNK
ncbi:hypothetical protein PAPHI01_1413 [Pancytospora philotis]|nr:hypothetical protein PAPHI01_1413 [Pancytospora philotis]